MKKLVESKKTGAKTGTKVKKNSVKGKQILVGGLVVMVAIAGYYRYSLGNDTPSVSDETAVPVMSTATVNDENYFALARKERDSARSEAEDLFKEITEDDSSTADAKADAGEKLKTSAEAIKKEGEIESLIKAKGYKECIVFIDEKEIRLIVQVDKLDEKKVSQISEIITSKTDFKPSEIIISNHE